MTKPRAYYEEYGHYPSVGERVYLFNVEHPDPSIRGNVVITTPVVRLGPLGEIETENTLYFPKTPLHDDEE